MRDGQAVPVSTWRGCGRRMSSTLYCEPGILGPARVNCASLGSDNHTAQAGCSAIRRLSSAGSTVESCAKAGISTGTVQARTAPKTLQKTGLIGPPCKYQKGKSEEYDSLFRRPCGSRLWGRAGAM